MIRFIRACQNYITRQTVGHLSQINLFAWVMLINYPFFAFLWSLDHPLPMEELVLRGVATLLCLGLLLCRWWSFERMQLLLPGLWYVTLLFCLPGFYFYATFLHHGATIWLMNCVAALFFLLLLVRVFDALILTGLGLILSMLCYFYVGRHVFYYDPGHVSILNLFSVFISVFIIGTLFAHDRELSQEQKITAMQLLAGGLAHDLRTSLASIHLQADLQNLLIEKLKNPELQTDLRRSVNNIIRGIELGNQLITMQLKNIQHERLDTHAFEIHSIRLLLEKTIQEYPYRKAQRDLIHVSYSPNFSVWIDEIAFKNLVWNLLKNSLDYIDEIGKGEISIWLVEGVDKDNFNYLHLKDTSKGLYPKNAEKIFESFYSERQGGTGVGLSYCKLLMKAAGGDIVCEGKLGKYAHFIMKFPKID